MSHRPGPNSLRPVPVVAGFGVAGLAALAVIAPSAQAASPDPAATSAPAGATGSTTAKAAPKAVKPAADVVAPDFGTNKIRVGVQQKDGDYYPAGTTTAGTTVTIDETGPNADLAQLIWGTSCVTQADTGPTGSTETLCLFVPMLPSSAARQALARVHGTRAELSRLNRAVTRMASAAPEGLPFYSALPGDSVTFTQTTVRPNMVIDPVPQTFGPCVNPPSEGVVRAAADDPLPNCPASVDEEQHALFTDPGLPPLAVDDAATTRTGEAVGIPVLTNDTTHGAPVTITGATHPGHGTVSIHPLVGAPVPTQAITYTPAAGFVGVDRFDYTIHTANGDSTATVTVTVTAPPPTAVDDSAVTTPGGSVTVHVTGNDSAHGGGALHLDSTTAPAHGRVRVDGLNAIYTANDDFAGIDTFDYTISTPFGTATATVTVTVTAPFSVAPTSASRSTTPVADTGVPSSEYIDIALALMVTGGAAAYAGRRRYRGRHGG